MSEENKKVAMAFYEKALNDRDVETAFRLYAGKHYRQHNPLGSADREGSHESLRAFWQLSADTPRIL